MSYTLFVAENCHQCAEVLTGLENRSIKIKTVNVDKEQAKPPIEVFAFPVLFKNDILMRYGSDILDFFDREKA